MHDFLVDFSLKWTGKVEFSISVIIENCAWGKSGKNSKYKIYLMKCIQKGEFSKMTIFSPKNLDEIMPKNPK